MRLHRGRTTASLRGRVRWVFLGIVLASLWLWLVKAALAAAPPSAPAAAIASPVPPAALPPMVTLEEALRLFRSSGLDLLLADAAVASAHGSLRIARSLYNPGLSASRGSTTTYDPKQCGSPGCSDVQYSGSVSDQGAVLDVLSGKRHLRVAAAQQALRAAELSRRDAERTVGFLVKQQYAAAVLAKASLAFAGESRASNEQTFRLVETRYEAGAVSEADVARAEGAELESEQAYDLAAQSLRQAKVALAFLLGVRSTIPEYDVGDEVLARGDPAALVTASPESLIALAQRSDVRAAEAQRARAEAALALARRLRLPDVSLAAQYTREGTGQSAIQPPTTAFGLSFTAPLFYRHQGEIAMASADLRAQEVQRARVGAQVVSDVEGGLAAFHSARRRLDRMDSRQLERARRARDLVQLQYEMGAASLLELLDAQRTLISVGVERLQILSDYWTAVFELEQAVGTELRQ